MGLDAMMLEAMVDEITKIAAVSSPGIIAAPSPAGNFSGLTQSTPAAPVRPAKIRAKVLGSTNLAKTNYTSVHQTSAPPAPASLTSEQKGLAPPVVRSS